MSSFFRTIHDEECSGQINGTGIIGNNNSVKINEKEKEIEFLQEKLSLKEELIEELRQRIIDKDELLDKLRGVI